MLLVKTTANGEVEQFPYTLGDLRRDNPNTSYPKKIGDAILADNLIFHVMHETLPEYDSLVQSLVRDAAPVKEVRTKQPEDEFLADVAVGDTYETGRWVIGYTVENKPQDQAEAAIRNQRDHLLSDMEERMITLFKRMDTLDSKQGADSRRLTLVESKVGTNGQYLRFAERIFWIVVAASITYALNTGVI